MDIYTYFRRYLFIFPVTGIQSDLREGRLTVYYMRVKLELETSSIATGSATGHPSMIPSESKLIYCIGRHDVL